MSTDDKRQAQAVFPREDRPTPVATFKNSLRLWQARWKAQQARSLNNAEASTQNEVPGK